jgi:outer membrane protein TolC
LFFATDRFLPASKAYQQQKWQASNANRAVYRMWKNSNLKWTRRLVLLALVARFSATGQVPSNPLGYSVATPRPINPAESTTNPSALATQAQNPYLGSVPQKASGTRLELTLESAIQLGLRYNLGLIESNQASADVRAARLRALSALLPQISAEGKQVFENISFKEIGLKLPPIPGFPGLSSTTGGFGYQDARVSVTQSLYNAEMRGHYQAQKEAEKASVLSSKDSRDVVVFAIGTAYLQVSASAARVETAKAQLNSALELDRQTTNQFKSEVVPEIDTLRAQVERQSAEQRLTNALNQLEKDKLTLARICGLAIDQEFNLADSLVYRPISGVTRESALEDALRSRSDLASAEAGVRAAELNVRSQQGQRLPSFSFQANYGGGSSNIGNFNQVYSVAGVVSVPLYTGGRIRSDVQLAQSTLARRQAEYADLKGRIAYDVRISWLDLKASESSVQVAQRNKALADRALVQSQDRYTNGVTNYLEVVQAQETVVSANENYIESLYSFNVAKIAFARAVGNSETRLRELFGGK